MEATDCAALFGPNMRRAEIRYRRLARAVHPDMGGGMEAMKRLNALWDEYKARAGAFRRTDGARRRPAEVTRNEAYVVLDEGDRWVVVDRAVSGPKTSRDSGELADVVEGSPVCVLGVSSTKSISQPDGAHAAYECVPDRSLSEGRRMTFLSSLGPHLPDGTMHPADLAWVTKRVLFLALALESVDSRLARPACECLAVAPDTHMLALVSPWDVEHGCGRVRRDVAEDYRARMGEVSGDGPEARRISRFVEGFGVDGHTPAADIMREYDELMVELFGGLRFHEMKTV